MKSISEYVKSYFGSFMSILLSFRKGKIHCLFGLVNDTNRLLPIKEKVQTIVKARNPDNVCELLSFLGMVQQ